MDDAEEIFNISYCYEHGIGVEEDKHKALSVIKKLPIEVLLEESLMLSKQNQNQKELT